MRTKTQITDIIYTLIIISALANIRYQLAQSKIWYHIYMICIVGIVTLDLLYICSSLVAHNGLVHVSLCFAILFVLYELIVSFFNDLLFLQTSIRDIVPWPITFAILYIHIKEKGVPKSYKTMTIIGLIACCILSIPNIINHLHNFGRHGGVVFPIYYCFVFLGILLRLCNSKLRYIFMGLVSVLLFVSTKRAGVAITLVGIVIYMILDAHVQGDLQEQRKKYFGFAIVIIIASIIGYQLIERYSVSTLSRFGTMIEDEGSGRGYIWRTAISYYQNSSLPEKLFGHGYHSFSYDITFGNNRRLMAHNSYLETMLDYGIIGVSIIGILSIYLIYKTVVMIKNKSPNAPAMAYSIVGLLVLGFFSYFFEQSILIMGYIVLWSICLGDEYYQSFKSKR